MSGALRKKLFRDLWVMKGQVLAIAMVLASGVASYVGLSSTLASLRQTQSRFYASYRFADVFCSLKRAPQSLTERLADISGVGSIQTRVVGAANLELPGFDDPISGLIVSIPNGAQPRLNRIYLREGRLPAPGREDEVVVADAFAQAHGLHPGSSLTAVVNGRRKRLRVVGVGVSPEFVYLIKPGDLFPDYQRYAVLWMNRKPLANAFNMEGAFNNVTFRLTAHASEPDVIGDVDRILNPYGGLGAHGRKYQVSARYLSQEMHELGAMATTIPLIFLAVAAFLLNVVVGRLIRNQREQIAILKAFGYSNGTVGMHYAAMVAVIVVVGSAIGLAMGGVIGRAMSANYSQFFRFPHLDYVLPATTMIVAIAVTALASFAGSLGAVAAAVELPPAQAMLPEPPPLYRRTLIERLGLQRLLDQPTRMVVRHIERQTLKSALSVLGIALAVAVMMVGRFGVDAIRHMIDMQYGLAQREDLTVTFNDPVGRRAVQDLESIRGVRYAEPFRAVPVELVHAYRRYRTEILGLSRNPRLHRVLDSAQREIRLPRDGVVLTDYLGTLLHLRVGDYVSARVLEGARPVLRLPVAGFASEYLGAQAYMRLDALNAAMGEGGAISGAYLAAEESRAKAIFQALRGSPRVAGVGITAMAIKAFFESIGRIMDVFTLVSTLLAGSIAFGVVYNSARIALSERSRELASLRVLGYSRAEVSYILLGELGLLTLIAVGPGFLIGRGFCRIMVENFKSDLYRIPLVIAPATYAFAAAVVFGAALLSAVLMQHRLNRLDMVSALKTRE